MPSNLLHGIGEVEQRALAGAGSAAAHVDRRHRRRIEDDGGHPGRQRGVVGVTDADAGNIGEQIFQEQLRQVVSRLGVRLDTQLGI